MRYMPLMPFGVGDHVYVEHDGRLRRAVVEAIHGFEVHVFFPWRLYHRHAIVGASRVFTRHDR